MSFLAEVEDEQFATLEFAFALIDSADDATSSDSTSNSPGASEHTYDDLAQPSLQLSDGLDAFLATDALSSSDADLVLLQPLEPPTTQPTIPFAVSPRAAPAAKPLNSAAAMPTKKARSNAGYVARHRERRKAEMVTLRSQVGELGATLAQLQSRRLNRSGALQYLLDQQRNGMTTPSDDNDTASSPTTKPVAIQPKPTQVSVWLDVAAFQAQERYKSETLNAKLKDAIARQLKVVKALEAVLGKKAAVFGLDLLRHTQQQELRDDYYLAQEDHVFTRLRDELKQMYVAADTLFAPQNWADATHSIACSTHVTIDPTTGATVMEVRTSTPLQCSFERVGTVMGDHMCQLLKGNDKNYHFRMQMLTPRSFKKSYTIIMDGPDGRPLELRGVSYAEMVQEPTRMLWMWRSLLLLSGSSGGPRFAENGWIVTENVRGPSTESPTSVYRSCYHVSCDTVGNLLPHDPSTTQLIETVLQTLSARTRAHQQLQQNLLLDEFAGLSIHRPTAQLLAGR